jgi:hypothetical protein
MIESQQRDQCRGCGILLAPIDPADPDDFGELCVFCLAAHPLPARHGRSAGDSGRTLGGDPTASTKPSDERIGIKRLADPQLRLFVQA